MCLYSWQGHFGWPFALSCLHAHQPAASYCPLPRPPTLLCSWFGSSRGLVSTFGRDITKLLKCQMTTGGLTLAPPGCLFAPRVVKWPSNTFSLTRGWLLLMFSLFPSSLLPERQNTCLEAMSALLLLTKEHVKSQQGAHSQTPKNCPCLVRYPVWTRWPTAAFSFLSRTHGKVVQPPPCYANLFVGTRSHWLWTQTQQPQIKKCPQRSYMPAQK